MRTLTKPLDVLEAFLSTNNTELKLSELVKTCRFSPSTVQRVINLLVQDGYLRQRRKRGNYSLGPKFYQFCSLLHRSRNIENIAQYFLEKLTKATSETALLSILGDDEVIISNVSPSIGGHYLRLNLREGFRLPLHCTASGKIFLAFMTPQELSKLYRNRLLTKFTNNTVADLSSLKKELQKIRQEGVAFNYEEQELGICSISAPVREWSGKVIASIGIAAPAARFTKEKMKQTAHEIIRNALEMSREIGYTGTDVPQNSAFLSTLPPSSSDETK